MAAAELVVITGEEGEEGEEVVVVVIIEVVEITAEEEEEEVAVAVVVIVEVAEVMMGTVVVGVIIMVEEVVLTIVVKVEMEMILLMLMFRNLLRVRMLVALWEVTHFLQTPMEGMMLMMRRLFHHQLTMVGPLLIPLRMVSHLPIPMEVML